VQIALATFLQTIAQTPKVPADGEAAKLALVTALITAALTLAGIVLKDLLFKVLEERRAEKRAELVVYEQYSRPLAASATSLLHRLREILVGHSRPVFLKSVGVSVAASERQGPEFLTYKKLSTFYRLATLLGWIRACRREFSYLRVAERKDNEPIDRAINLFENALADGSWVEHERVKRLCDIWHICSPDVLENSPDVLAALGVKIDNAIYAAENSDLLDDPSKEALCTTMALILTTGFNTNPVGKASLQRTWPEAFRVIAMREAWLYRDWQSAIGDLMLRSLEGEDRRFEVIGYGEFEKMCRSGDPEEELWVTRLAQVFEDLDFSIADRFDARPRQLRTVARATAKLVLALHQVQGAKSVINTHTAGIADSILNEISEE